MKDQLKLNCGTTTTVTRTTAVRRPGGTSRGCHQIQSGDTTRSRRNRSNKDTTPATTRISCRSDVSDNMCSSLKVARSSGLRGRGSLLIAVLLVLLSCSALFTSTRAQNQCPSMCSCIWRGGKQTSLCENQGLISIPSGISSSTQVLNLNKNNFQILPTRVFQERGLINLQKVFLAECKLGVIAPDSFVQLTNLVELDLSSNLLTTVPSEALENTPNVRRLQLNGNPIQALKRESLSMLPQLTSLELSSCQIDLIEPGAFRGLSSLQYLKLDGNRLSTISALVLQDLPPLFMLDLHKNPWNCDCELKPAHEWIDRHNVPQSIPPTCSGPPKMAGTMWNTLQSSEEFACTPKILTRETDVTAFAGLNATFTCTIWSQPEARITWLIEDQVFRNLSSPAIVKGERFSFTEERGGAPDTIMTTLTITNVDPSDSGKTLVCHAENSAGVSSKNFTLGVLPTSSHPSYAGGWTKVEVAGGVVGLLLVVVVSFVLVAVCLLRIRRGGSGPDGKAPLPQIDVLKNISSPVGVIKSKSAYDDKTITADGKGHRPETGASSGYGSNGVTPDLTSNAQQRSNGGLSEMMSLNGYGHHDGHHGSGYILSSSGQHQVQGEYLGGSSGLLQQVPGVEHHLKSPYNYPANNYENYEICDAYNYAGEQEVVHYGQAGGMVDMPHAYYQDSGAQYSMGVVPAAEAYWTKSRGTPVAGMSASAMSVGPDHHQQQQLQHHQSNYLNQNVQQSPHSSSQHLQVVSGVVGVGPAGAHAHVNVVGTGSYNVAHPTVVRYSPDEGYAEEPANNTYTLEGTEV